MSWSLSLAIHINSFSCGVLSGSSPACAHFGFKQCIKPCHQCPARENTLLNASLLVKLGRKLGATEEVQVSEVDDALEGVQIGSYWHPVVVNLKESRAESFSIVLCGTLITLTRTSFHFHGMLIASCARTLES